MDIWLWPSVNMFLYLRPNKDTLIILNLLANIKFIFIQYQIKK